MSERQIRAFLAMAAAERGAAKNTLDAYARDLGDYLDHLNHARLTTETAGVADLRGYLQALAERDFKGTTIARRLSAQQPAAGSAGLLHSFLCHLPDP